MCELLIISLVSLALASGGMAQASFPKFGNWWPEHQFFGGFEFQGIEIADMNGDGALDIVQPGVLAAQPKVFLNLGNCRFDHRPSTGWPYQLFSAGTWYVAVGDVDRDGDVDLIAPSDLNFHQGSPDKALYLNDGQGNLAYDSTGRLPSSSFQGTATVLRDLDGDGDLDLIALNRDVLVTPRVAPLQILINDGTGRFRDETASRFSRAPAEWYDAAVLDVNRDGYPDIAAGGGGNVLEIWLNNGAGRFALGQTLPVGTFGLVAADVDSDGWRDLIAGGFNRLYLNRNGTLADETFRLPPGSGFYRAAVTDMDRDGIQDLVLASGLLRGTAQGSFIDVTQQATYTTWPLGGSRAIGDMDGDGDSDIVWTRYDACGVLLNLRSHIQAPPTVGRGQTFKVDVFGNPSELVLPWIGVQLARFNIPGLGIWRLAPEAMAPLPALGLTSFPSQLSLPIPNDPALANLNFYLQAIHVQQEQSRILYRLTHWREVTIQ